MKATKKGNVGSLFEGGYVQNIVENAEAEMQRCGGENWVNKQAVLDVEEAIYSH